MTEPTSAASFGDTETRLQFQMNVYVKRRLIKTPCAPNGEVQRSVRGFLTCRYSVRVSSDILCSKRSIIVSSLALCAQTDRMT